MPQNPAMSVVLSVPGGPEGSQDFPRDFPTCRRAVVGVPSGVLERPWGRQTTPSRANEKLAQNSLAAPGPWRSVTGMQAPSTANPPAALAEDRLLRPEQAAWYLNVKTSWVYEAVRTGRLPCHRVGRHIRFTRHMLDDWLAEQPKL